MEMHKHSRFGPKCNKSLHLQARGRSGRLPSAVHALHGQHVCHRQCVAASAPPLMPGRWSCLACSPRPLERTSSTRTPVQ
eukprot:6462686-Amphidinium_carterae.1